MPWNALTNLTLGTINTVVDGIKYNENMKWTKEAFQRQQDFEREMAKKAQDFEKAESELAFQREKDMWNMQNAYNTPQEQMKRYQEAGLSPYLIYGQGTPGNATDSPSYQPTKATKPDTLTPPSLPTYKSSLPTNLNWLESSQTLSSIKANEASEALARANAKKVDSETQSNQISLRYQNMKELLQVKYQLLLNLKEQGIITNQELKNEYQSFENQLFKDTYDIQKQQFTANLKATEEDIKVKGQTLTNLKIEESIKYEMIEKIKAETANIKSNEDKVRKTIEILGEKLSQEQIKTSMQNFFGITEFSGNPLKDLSNMIGNDLRKLEIYLTNLFKN